MSENEIVFESRVSKAGPIYYIAIPKALHSMIKNLHGKRVTVVIKPAEEVEKK